MTGKRHRPSTDSEDRADDHLKPTKPAGSEPVQDEEMFVDPLIRKINTGDGAEDPPPNT